MYEPPQPASEKDCAGMQELAQAVRTAWEKAKRNKEGMVYKKLIGGRCPRTLNLVRFLQENDDEFHPSDWYLTSVFATVKNPGSFNRKIQEVQRKVPGWSWESWRS